MLRAAALEWSPVEPDPGPAHRARERQRVGAQAARDETEPMAALDRARQSYESMLGKPNPPRG